MAVADTMTHVTFPGFDRMAEARVLLIVGTAPARAVGKLLAEATGHGIIENHGFA